jgi:hypothetical protein
MEPITFELDAREALRARGFAWIPRASWVLAPGLSTPLEALRESFEHLELDRYLAGGARFRWRRYGRAYWAPATDTLRLLPHEPYFQPEAENAYAGGVAREFAPVLADTAHNPFVRALIRACFAGLPIPEAQRRQTWEVRMHQLRIVSTPQAIGLPTPEGIHQDGTDFHTLHLMRRDNVEGAVTSIHDLERRPVCELTFRDVLDTLILQDPRVMHAVTPVLPADGEGRAVRDVFGIDYHHRPQLNPPD